MRLELQRSGGFTGNTLRWRLESADEADWQDLLDRAGLRFRGPLARVGWLLFATPLGAAGEKDYTYFVLIDGRRAKFRGVDVSGPLAELVDRVMREGEEIRSH
jgi:hypothetical protein